MSDSRFPAICPGQLAFEYKGVEFRFDDRQFINLTEMWKLTGSDEAKKPANWRRKDGRGFIDSLAKSLNVPLGHIIQGERGKGGATSAHWQVALAYTKYLSHEFHRLVNEAFRQWAEEAADPDLKVARAIEAYRRKGKSDEWIAERLESIQTRNTFTDTLKEHGVVGNGYAFCTHAINKNILGCSASDYKKRKGLSKNAKTRDELEDVPLGGVRFAETLSRSGITTTNAQGNADCQKVCEKAGAIVKAAMLAMSQ